MINTKLMGASDYQNALGQNIAARLSDGTKNLPHDISERLKVARAQALAKRKIVKLEVVSAVTLNGGGGVATLHMGGDGRSLWNRIGSLLPLFALIAGLLTIAATVDDNRTNEIAEIDAELLTDDLPPDAYTDPGFAQFLRVNHDN